MWKTNILLAILIPAVVITIVIFHDQIAQFLILFGASFFGSTHGN